jgi:hypothetical protein
MLASLLLGLCLIVAQTLIGVVISSWLLPRSGVSLQIGLGVLFGVLVAVMQQQALIAVGARAVYVPVLLASALASALSLMTRLRRGDFRAIAEGSMSKSGTSVALIHLSAVLFLLVPDWGWPLAFAALFLAIGTLLSAVTTRARTICGLSVAITVAWSYWTIRHLMTGNWWFADEDLYFYFGLGRGIAQFGFWENPFIVGRPFNYHWIPYAWSGWISTYVDDPDLTVFSLLYPTVAALAFVAMIRGVLCLLTTKAVSPYTVVAASATTTLWITSRAQVPVSVISLGTSLGHLSSLAVFGLLLHRVRSGPGWRTTTALSLVSVFLVGAKFHSAVPILAGAAVVLCNLTIKEHRGLRAVVHLAIPITVMALASYAFYSSRQSQGRLNFSVIPRFDYVNTWGDMLETSQWSHVVWGLVVGMAYLIPSITGTVVASHSLAPGSDSETRSVLTFVLVSSAVALILAATIQQVSGTSFFFLSFAPMLGGVLVFSSLESTSHKRLLVGVVAGVLLIWALANLPQVRHHLYEFDWRLERFRSFLLWNLVFALVIILTGVSTRLRRATDHTVPSPQRILVAAALSQLILVHSLNYHRMATRNIPATLRQSHLQPPAQSEIALASWFKHEIALNAVVASNNVDMRLSALIGKRWFISAPDFAKDGTEEGGRRGEILASFLAAPDLMGLQRLRSEGVDFFIFDNVLSESTLNTIANEKRVCYRDSRFEVVAMDRCP